MGSLRILEIIRFLGLKTKFYQATTSELFGEKGKNNKFSEKSEFNQIFMVYLNYLLIILQKFIESPMEFSHPVEYCLITKVQEEVKHLLQEKLQCFLLKEF